MGNSYESSEAPELDHNAVLEHAQIACEVDPHFLKDIETELRSIALKLSQRNFAADVDARETMKDAQFDQWQKELEIPEGQQRVQEELLEAFAKAGFVPSWEHPSESK